MEDLVDWLERILDESLKRAGFTVQTPQEGQKETTQRTGTITFVNGEKARQMKEFYQKQKGKK
jgi:hypothetical protein